MDIYFKIVALEDQINTIPKSYNTLKYLTYALKLLQKARCGYSGTYTQT